MQKCYLYKIGLVRDIYVVHPPNIKAGLTISVSQTYFYILSPKCSRIEILQHSQAMYALLTSRFFFVFFLVFLKSNLFSLLRLKLLFPMNMEKVLLLHTVETVNLPEGCFPVSPLPSPLTAPVYFSLSQLIVPRLVIIFSVLLWTQSVGHEMWFS